ncbi:circularly permuted type 2 ATP-grasp protein [Thioalkalicoccus limnaeus]|uniref:Circularly permuted type 2 ATP-grasp protein n=1 Tax=Thioalkalicoccus limnaeus TaxID=120681 RepID=A0ABV4B9K1_9GAMM
MPPQTAALSGGPTRLVDDYRPVAGVYDEMRTADGEVRPHWQYLIEVLRALGPDGIEERWRDARRLIRDNGVTYNAYGDTEGMSRPWELDLLPLQIRSDEWATLERGLIQRAELLNLILSDLYGPRKLITAGLLPATLIDAYPGYLIPCHGVPATDDQPLVDYAVDLTRTPDGAWRVIGDRTQCPSGAGYALENRVVLSRVMPSLFRDSHVHRLAGFYRSVRRALTRLAARRTPPTRIVMMTPGPSHEAYFEHAYLANYLGYNLVQGADLSVRDGALWLRTLGRLERIDAVLRRVDDLWCDPLELREDSHLGVPGLTQAARAGNVTLANALGSGVLEHPGLMAFLPRLCQHLLGEDLLLPDIPTWWCGEQADMARVLDELETLVIKPAGNPPGRRCLFPGRMDPAERAALVARIQAEPDRFVAQEHIVPSTAPALIGRRIEPRPTVLRTFLVAEEQGYTVMPGGLSRVAFEQDTPMISSRLGGIGKDTWVLASEPERQESLLGTGDLLAPAVAQESEVSSRVADNLFWIGRYAERAEGLVRLLRITIFKLSERQGYAATDDLTSCVPSLLQALTHQSQAYPGFVGDGFEERLRDPMPEMLSLIADPERLGGLPQTLQALGQAAWSVRERLSVDTWRVINDIEEHLRALTRRPPRDFGPALDELDPLVTALVAFSALTHENMTHNEGWNFLEAGRRLERGLNTATLLRGTLSRIGREHEEHLLIEAVLGITDSLITYRRRYQAGTRVGALLDLVFQDETNPRSLAYQLVQLERVCRQMPRGEMAAGRSSIERLILRSLTGVRLVEIDRLIQPDRTGTKRVALRRMLGQLSDQLAAVSDALTAQYFRHEEQPHALLGRVGRGPQ